MRGVSSCIVRYSVSGVLFRSRWREMERAPKKSDILAHFCEFGLGSVPDLDCVDV